jgi:putative membrane protein insertion efficiency factor
MRRFLRGLTLGLLALTLALLAESFLPPRAQISARAAAAAVRGYQALLSPLLHKAGVRCRYLPSCSAYALEALDAYGTLPGTARTLGRLSRCSPWGGVGYDPAVEPGAGSPAGPRLGAAALAAALGAAAWALRPRRASPPEPSPAS